MNGVAAPSLGGRLANAGRKRVGARPRPESDGCKRMQVAMDSASERGVLRFSDGVVHLVKYNSQVHLPLWNGVK